MPHRSNEDDEEQTVPDRSVPPDQAIDDTVGRLIQKLELAQARLRTVREESDAANEALRAANEELQTVNSELMLKLEAISRAHSDLQNLMAATDFGTLFLDSSLRIKRLTDPVREVFSITPSDEGRPITDFDHQLEYDDLVKDARAVLADLVPIRREVKSREGRCYDLRMQPYRTVDDRIDGIVITFIDITERQEVEAALRQSEARVRRQLQLVELSHGPIFVWDFDDGILEWNRGSEQLYGYSREEALGAVKSELLKTVVPGSSFEAIRVALIRDGGWSGELVQTARDGQKLTVESRLHLEVVEDRRLVLESTRDISDRKRWERRQLLLLRELAHRVKNTLAVVQSIARQTLRKTASPADFMVSLEGRLSALAKAHDLLVQSDWKGANLDALARFQLEPYTSDEPGRLRIEGPPVSLPADVATPFALVLHELAANAAKYGSLSQPNGSVSVTWTIQEGNKGNVLSVVWHEKSGMPVEEFKAAGLGTALIDQAIPGAVVSRDLGSDGFTCRIQLTLPQESLDESDSG